MIKSEIAEEFYNHISCLNRRRFTGLSQKQKKKKRENSGTGGYSIVKVNTFLSKPNVLNLAFYKCFLNLL